MKKIWLGATASVIGLCGIVAALGQTSPANNPITAPQVQSIGPNDLFQDIVGGNPQSGNVYALGSLLSGSAFSQAGATADNSLIGGDFYQNLWSRGTTSATINTTATYGPNNWFLWSGTSTNLVATQQTAAADITAGFLASARVTRSSTGVVQSCIAQEVESSIAERYQTGGTAEFDFHALAGAGFSSATSSLAVYIVTGTATDEGSSKLAYSVNAGGGGGSGWTGATLLGGTAGYVVPINTIWNRYTVVAPIASGTKEIGVAICWTPVGTSPSNDYFEFTGAQLVVNPVFAATAGSAGAVVTGDLRAKTFVRRNMATEVAQQQRYLYALNEASITAGAAFATGQMPTTTTCLATVPFPVTMRAAPTYTNALTASTFKLGFGGATSTILSTPFSATTAANTAANGSITFTSATLAGATAGFGCTLFSNAGTGLMLWSAEL